MRFQLFIIFMAMSFFVVAGSLEHNTSWHNGESNQSSPTWREEKESIVPFPSFTMGPHEIPDEADHGLSTLAWIGIGTAIVLCAVGVGWAVWFYCFRTRAALGGGGGGPQLQLQPQLQAHPAGPQPELRLQPAGPPLEPAGGAMGDIHGWLADQQVAGPPSSVSVAHSGSSVNRPMSSSTSGFTGFSGRS